MGCVHFNFFFLGGMTRCDSCYFRYFSYSTSQSVGDLPLRSSRGSHFSRMKSRCFAGASITTILIFFWLSPSYTEEWTNLHISSTDLALPLMAFIVPKSRSTGWHLLTRRSLLIS